ncbi:MAG: DUF3536 domain-containing protein [Thermodesulfobacteriota bacterium]
MEKYICIHGHFYQPPRENPWLEAIELQDSAYPFHDWNERITRECYAPNAAARLVDGEGRITRIVNNYAKISFTFGPILMAWLAQNSPQVYQAILQADKESQTNFSGHGSALAQPFVHMILPLANWRDKYTQIYWGIKDFEFRFGRKPEGLWLPETAVDLETLDILALLGIRFTILSPYQAQMVRALRGRTWHDVSGGRIDPSQAYSLRLPSGQKIDLFFYDGPISSAVAFGSLLHNGENFARRLMDAFDDRRQRDQLGHIATDGETYGHHYPRGEMALAYALEFITVHQMARITNYGEFLEKHPPRQEVKIIENTSWSCGHGVERWKNDCGCNSGRNPQWHQRWRAPLRQAFDWLRETLAHPFAEKGRHFLKDPWETRDEYIKIILNRSPENVENFFRQQAKAPLSPDEQITVLKLLEMQRYLQLMYTSCGWFFDELSGIETVQVIQYAGRALQLATEIFGNSWEVHFLELLSHAKSNLPEHQDGRHIYEKWVKPAMIDLKKVGAHYAIRSIFEPYAQEERIYCFQVEREDYQTLETGKLKLALGRARISSEITRESQLLTFGVLHFGDHNLRGGVREFQGAQAYQELKHELINLFHQGDIPEVILTLKRGFGEDVYSLKSLFRDEQRKVLNIILNSTLMAVEGIYRQLYEQHIPLMRFLSELKVPQPHILRMAAEIAMNASLRQILEAEIPNTEVFNNLVTEIRNLGLILDHLTLGQIMKKKIEKLTSIFQAHPQETKYLSQLTEIISLAKSLPFDIDFWETQNIYYEFKRALLADIKKRAENGEEEAQNWLTSFSKLGEQLGFAPWAS